MQLDTAQRAADMQRLRAGGLLTEFALYPDGDCPQPGNLTCMRRDLDVVEAVNHGYIAWEYASLFDGALVDESRAYEMARPFPMAVGGQLHAYHFDRAAGTLTLNFTVAPAAPANASTSVVFVSTGLYFPGGYSAALSAQPPDAVVGIQTPCTAGAGTNGTHVDPAGMNCAPAPPPLTPGAPTPYAYGYVVLSVVSQAGGNATLVVSGRPAPRAG